VTSDTKPQPASEHEAFDVFVLGWTDADADAARLALELECLLTDRDVPMPTLSRWWDSAHEALELHRERMRALQTAQPAARPHSADAGKRALAALSGTAKREAT